MRGKNVFYPIGWDDNGLPTERRVQNYFHVRCDPSLPYDPDFAPPASPGSEPVPVSRRNFVELCQQLTHLDEQSFEEVWRRLGLSVDWSTKYRTIDDGSRAISQRGFLRNLARGEAYLAEAPTLWDVTFQTAVAQAEIEDREVAGAYHRVRFHRPGGGAVEVATTRPELLPACVALVAHPGDTRYAALIGTTVSTPLFGVDVPVLTPQIATRWSLDGDLSGQVLPMDLRPQAHEIIRTWLFYTVLRSHTERGELPWRYAAISGWVLDPDRKKMSKSVGNVVTPMDSLRTYGSDAVRYWAAGGRLGADITFDPGQLRVGRRLAVKILNASRFVLGLAAPGSGGAGQDGPAGTAAALPAAVTEPLDVAMLGRLADVIGECTRSFEAYDHTGALVAAEEFFWFFCDDYLELVKGRGYGERGEEAAASAGAALRLALSAMLRLFAPFLPFVTEEVWSWWQEGSVHQAAWPTGTEVLAGAGQAGAGPAAAGPEVLRVASAAIAAIRGAKSSARLSMRAPVQALVVAGRRDHLDAVMAVLPDVTAAGKVERTELVFCDRPEPSYEVTL